MSSSLYKIVELYDNKDNKWKLARNMDRYEFPCSLALRDHLRAYDLPNINIRDLSDELQTIIEKQNNENPPLRYNYHLLDMSTLEEMRDKQWDNIVNIVDRKINCDTNTKLNLILDKLGIQKVDDTEYEETIEDIKESISWDLELALGVESDISEIDMLAKLYSDNKYKCKKRIIVYYC